MFSKLILSICVPRLLDSALRGEYSRLAHRSSAMLSKLYNELVDCDSIHCLPGECFGSPARVDEVNPPAWQPSEPTQDSETQGVRICTSVLAGAGIVHPAGMEQGMSSQPSASGSSAEYEPKETHNVGPVSAMDTDECRDTFGLAQEGPGNEHGPDSGMDFVSDTLWTLDDGGTSTGFPDLVAVELSTDSMSDAGALTPLTLPSLDSLLPIGSAEFAKD